MKSQRKIVVIPDLHARAKSGGEDKRSLAAVEKYIKDTGCDEILQIGDFLDFDCISDHNAFNLRATENTSIEADYAVGNKILDRWQKLCKNVTILEGNHDFRVERFIDAYPRMAGSLEVDKGLHLADRGVKWVRSWSKGDTYKIGNAVFIHGLYTNEHHAKKHVQAFGRPVFYGHTHDIQQFSQVTAGDNKTVLGQSLGCLCDYRQQYMKGRPNRWQQAFGVFYFQANGYFNYYIPMIFNHQFTSPEGEVYKG